MDKAFFEYKVLYGNGTQRDCLEEFLNKHANDGWRVIAINEYLIILEREKEK